MSILHGGQFMSQTCHKREDLTGLSEQRSNRKRTNCETTQILTLKSENCSGIYIPGLTSCVAVAEFLCQILCQKAELFWLFLTTFFWISLNPPPVSYKSVCNKLLCLWHLKHSVTFHISTWTRTQKSHLKGQEEGFFFFFFCWLDRHQKPGACCSPDGWRLHVV